MQDNTIIFRELLSEVKELAERSGGSLTKKDIDLFFASAQLSPEQMELIYDYLRGQGIRVQGTAPAKKTVPADAALSRGSRMGVKDTSSGSTEDDDEEDLMGLYLRDINALPDLEPEEEKQPEETEPPKEEPNVPLNVKPVVAMPIDDYEIEDDENE